MTKRENRTQKLLEHLRHPLKKGGGVSLCQYSGMDIIGLALWLISGQESPVSHADYYLCPVFLTRPSNELKYRS